MSYSKLPRIVQGLAYGPLVTFTRKDTGAPFTWTGTIEVTLWLAGASTPLVTATLANGKLASVSGSTGRFTFALTSGDLAASGSGYGRIQVKRTSAPVLMLFDYPVRLALEGEGGPYDADGTVALDLTDYRVSVDSVALGALDLVSVKTETLEVTGVSTLADTDMAAVTADSVAVTGAVTAGSVEAADVVVTNSLAITGTGTLNGRPVLTEKDFGRVIELTSVGGTSGAFTATSPLPITEMQDGGVRLFSFVAPFDAVPNPANSNRVTLAVNGDASPNIIRTMDDVNLLRGAIMQGRRYILAAQGSFFYLLGQVQSDALTPPGNELALWSSTGNGAYEIAEALAPLLPPNVSSAYEQRSITGNNLPRHIGLLERDRPWHALPGSAQQSYIDCTWMGNGQTVRIFCANTAGNAVARLYQGDGTWQGYGTDKFITIQNGAQVTVSKYQVSGAVVYVASAEAGAAPVGSAGGASQTDVARTRSVILGGQSLSLRCLQAGLPTEYDLGIEDITPAQGRATRFISTGAGSSSLFWATDNTGGKTNHWWDERTDVAGPLAIAAVATINAYIAGRPGGEPLPSLLHFNIGQNDVDNIGDTGTVTIRTVRAHYRKVFSYIRTNCSLPSLITPVDILGGDEFIAASDAQFSMFRCAQLLACKTDAGADDPLVRPGAEFYNLPRMPDDVHMSFEGIRLQARAYVDLFRELILGQSGAGPVQGMGARGLTEVSQTEVSSTVFQFRWRSTSGFGSNRNTTYRPAGLELLPNAVPSVNDVPIPIRSWRVVTTGVTNELIIEYTTRDPASGAKFVTNWGSHGLANWLGRAPSDSWTRRGLVTIDPRASLVTLP